MSGHRSTFPLRLQQILSGSRQTSPALKLESEPLMPVNVGNNGGGGGTRILTYIVHVEEPNGTEFLRFRDRRDWYKSFLPNSTLDSGQPRLLYAYRHVISGFAARLSEDEARAMESMDGFLKAFREKKYPVFTTYTPDYLRLRQMLNGFWYPSNSGQGVIIGVLDTGIHPSHPSFKEDPLSPMPPPDPQTWKGKCRFGPTYNNKLIGSIGFSSGKYKMALDDNGHGTHVAGTAAGSRVDDAEVLGEAKGNASGIAPRAHLAIYKVVFKDYTGKSWARYADILRGIDEAINDGVHVLSMSLGAANQKTPLGMEKTPVIIGSFAAMKNGIVPVAAAGNDGPMPSIITNDAPWMMTVGAASIGRRITATVKLGNGKEYDGESSYQPAGYLSPQLPLIYPGASRKTDDYVCNGTFAGLSLKGKIVMWAVGGPPNDEKGKNVAKHGGEAMILLNAWTGGNTTRAYPNVIPASNINNLGMLDLITYAATPNPTAAIIFKGTQFVGHAPAVAAFSSRGPSLQNGGIIKPDIVAPGVNILAAWPFEVGPYPPTGNQKTFNFLSGTSMATPHVSGIVALLKNLHPTWSPAAIHSAIMTTSKIKDNYGVNITDEYKKPMGVFSTGSGHVDPWAASDPGLVYEREEDDYIKYLCGMGLADWKIKIITKSSVTCSPANSIDVEQLNYPSIALSLGPSSKQQKTVTRTLTNVMHSSETYHVDFMEPEGTSIVVSPTSLQFQGLNDKQNFTVTITLHPSRRAGATGQVLWDSGKHLVRTPIHFTYA